MTEMIKPQYELMDYEKQEDCDYVSLIIGTQGCMNYCKYNRGMRDGKVVCSFKADNK